MEFQSRGDWYLGCVNENDESVKKQMLAYLIKNQLLKGGEVTFSPNMGSTPKVGAIDGRALVPVNPTQPASAAILEL